MTFTQLFIFTTEYECDLVIHTNTRTSFTEEGYILSIELFPLVWLSISQYKANGLETRTENIFCLQKFDRGCVWWEDITSVRNQKTQSTNQHIINVSRLTGLTCRLTNHMGIINRAVGIRENITRETIGVYSKVFGCGKMEFIGRKNTYEREYQHFSLKISFVKRKMKINLETYLIRRISS